MFKNDDRPKGRSGRDGSLGEAQLTLVDQKAVVIAGVGEIGIQITVEIHVRHGY